VVLIGNDDRATAVVDETGAYRFDRVPAGEWAIVTTSSGTAPAMVRFRLGDGAQSTQDFTMR
jgi:hypothetical protein